MRLPGMCDAALDYAGYASPVEGLGPGLRTMLWVRGCHRHCPGCIAPELWEPGEPTPVAQLAALMLPSLRETDGLSISGGEPFEQPEALCALIDLLRQALPVEILIYTGYHLDELQASGDASQALLQRCDLLIDGPFLDTALNTLQWRGSDNQHVHLLSAQAQRHHAAATQPMPDQRPLKVQVLDARHYRIIGIPRRGDLAAYRAAMSARGFEVK